MRYIEILFVNGESSKIGFVRDKDFIELLKAFNKKSDRFVLDLFPRNEEINLIRHHLNLNAVSDISELS